MEKIELRQAIKASGGYTAVARKLGVKKQAIWEWVNKTRVPAERVIAFEGATGIARQLIRPDIYPD